jgi:AmiR/NasT family two-component response regulator
MTHVLRIAVADDEPRMLQFYDMALGQLGHEVVVKAENGRMLLEECRNKHPDLVITDIKMPDMDGLEAVTLLRNEQPIPVILVSAFNDSDYVEKAVRSHVLAYLIKPIKKEDLGPAISLVMQRFQEFQALRQEAADLRQALEDRKVIEQAKGILMKRTGLSEPDAFKRLQLLSSQKSRKMIEVAKMLVMAEEAFS